MSEGHADPPADVRSFLPRPGEPVEEYAQRLRALHRDLTLVLEAVERGLAAAAAPEDQPPMVPAEPPRHEPAIEPRTVEVRPRAAPGLQEAHVAPPTSPLAPPLRGGGGARVEVMPAPTGEDRREGGEDRRAQVTLPPEAHEELEDPGERASGPPGRFERFPSRPSGVATSEAEPTWVHRGPQSESFTAATFGAPPGSRPAPPPALLAALVAGWLTVVALVLALVLG